MYYYGPILGQEAIVPGGGLGRIVKLHDDGDISVLPYICDYPSKYDKNNVKLVEIKLQESTKKFDF